MNDPQSYPLPSNDADGADGVNPERLRRLGVMAAGMAHDTQNLLTPILGQAALARRRLGDADAVTAKSLAAIESAAAQAAGVCESVMEMVRGALADQQTELSPLVDQSFQLLEQISGGAEITLLNQVDDVRVQMSPACLKQVVINLGMNAVQAMRRLGGTLIISTHRVPQQPQQLELRIQDSGPGITESAKAGLFQPLDASQAGATHGFGLWFCREIIESAGGHIAVESGIGRGTTFRIKLNHATTNAARISA